MIACKGEMVTCENGHVICEVVQDMGRYSGASIEMFAAWRIDMPSEGGQLMRFHCPCGAEFMRPMSKNLHHRSEPGCGAFDLGSPRPSSLISLAVSNSTSATSGGVRPTEDPCYRA